MNKKRNNILKNKKHYDSFYSKVDTDKIINKLQNVDIFLSDAILTDTSWHGMYLNKFSERIKGKEVLEIGCGDGLNALIMAVLGAKVTANDISSRSGVIINEVSAKLGLDNISFVEGEFQKAEMKTNSFDFIIGKAFLHHLTHTLEEEFLCQTAKLLKPDGEVRFFEPAMNSKLLDNLRLMVPVSGRPSSMSKKAYNKWKVNDPHPQRDNSSSHYIKTGKRYFTDVEVTYVGTVERLSRLMPENSFNRKYRRWAHRIESKLPKWFRYKAARSQLIRYRNPK